VEGTLDAVHRLVEIRRSSAQHRDGDVGQAGRGLLARGPSASRRKARSNAGLGQYGTDKRRPEPPPAGLDENISAERASEMLDPEGDRGPDRAAEDDLLRFDGQPPWK
jgi:hypothetical protein